MLILQTLHRASIVAAIAARLSIVSPPARFVVTAFNPLVHTNVRSMSPAPLFSSAAASPAPPSATPTRYMLSYDYAPDVLEKRGPYREGHLGLAKGMVADGTCISGGPTLPPGESVPNGGEWMMQCEFSSLKVEESQQSLIS
jgi:hypothetical protein